MKVKDHPIFKREGQIGFDWELEQQDMICCEMDDCETGGCGLYYLFHPCPACMEDEIVAYRIAGKRIERPCAVVHICETCNDLYKILHLLTPGEWCVPWEWFFLHGHFCFKWYNNN